MIPVTERTLTIRLPIISFEPTRNEIFFFREKTFSKFTKLFDTEKTFSKFTKLFDTEKTFDCKLLIKAV